MRVVNYTIRMQLPFSSSNSALVEAVLCKNFSWAIATNDAMYFETVNAAVLFAKENKIVETRPKLGSETKPYIVGPYGGVYSIFTGRLLQ